MPGNPTLLAPGPSPTSLDQRHLDEFATMFASRSFSKGETLLAIGDRVEVMYLLRQGRVQLFVENNLGERVVLREVGPGELFGESALLDGGANPFSASATEDCQVLVLRREDLEELLGRSAGTATAMLTALCWQLRAATDQIRDVTPSTLEDQMAQDRSVGSYLADHLARLAGSPKSFVVFGIVLAIAMYVSRVPLPWITGTDKPLDEYYDFLNLGLTALAALQAPLILLVLNRSAFRSRLKEDIDLQFEVRVESRLAQLRAKVDSNQQELRQLLAEAKALSAGSRAQTRGLS